MHIYVCRQIYSIYYTTQCKHENSCKIRISKWKCLLFLIGKLLWPHFLKMSFTDLWMYFETTFNLGVKGKWGWMRVWIQGFTESNRVKLFSKSFIIRIIQLRRKNKPSWGLACLELMSRSQQLAVPSFNFISKF